jgi:hypothetical protein
MFQFFIQAVHHIISFILCWSMNVQNNDMTPVTSCHQLAQLSELLIWFHYSQRNLYLIHGSQSPFRRKMYIYSPAGSVPPPSHLTCTSTKSNVHLDSSFKTVIREPTLCKLLLFHMPNLISIFCSLGHLLKKSVQVFLWSFVTGLFFKVSGC